MWFDDWVNTQETDRIRALLQTGLAISSELSLDAVLARIVEAAALVTSARYAALGVIDQSGTALERFVTHGIDDEARARIGDLPRGRGVLGALIQMPGRCGCTRSPTIRAASASRRAIRR